jgi:uncharacterized membrane protein
MAFCSACGANVPENTAFCPSCGKAQGIPAGQASPSAQLAAVTEGLAENVAGPLCYLVGWITGLIFFFVDKRRTVRWHAAQSIVIFGGLTIISWALGIVFSATLFSGAWGLISLLHSVIWLVGVVLWILCMVKAYQGVMFRVPIAAGIADSFVK